jgi:uncharacterized membrane protein
VRRAAKLGSIHWRWQPDDLTHLLKVCAGDALVVVELKRNVLQQVCWRLCRLKLLQRANDTDKVMKQACTPANHALTAPCCR